MPTMSNKAAVVIKPLHTVLYRKYYREDGELVLDVGPFSKALEVCIYLIHCEMMVSRLYSMQLG